MKPALHRACHGVGRLAWHLVFSDPARTMAALLGALLLAFGATHADAGTDAAALPTATTAPALAVAGDAGTGLGTDVEREVRRLALDGSQAGAPGTPRIDVQVGQLDPRLKLAPCQRIEPYLAPGTRLWGRTRIGLRCTEGVSKWNVYLPVTVQVFGRALVTTGVLAAGSVVGPGDLMPAEVDLAEDPSPAVTDPRQAVGRTLLQPLKPGQSVRLAQLKARVWFNAGDMVKVRAMGSGFTVASEAQAMTPGIEGQPARVRTEAGRILTGQPVGDRELEVML